MTVMVCDGYLYDSRKYRPGRYFKIFMVTSTRHARVGLKRAMIRSVTYYNLKSL